MSSFSSRHTRRRFLKKGAALAGAAAALRFSRGPVALAGSSPGIKLGVAVIGAGGMGGYSVSSALGERLVALVDIDDNVWVCI